MTYIFPLNTNDKLVDKLGTITVATKRYFDDLLARMGGPKGGIYNQLIDGASILWDVDQSPSAVVVLGGNRTVINPATMAAGPITLYRLTVVQDATGSRTITWGSAFKFPGGVAPTLSTAANAVDELIFDSDGSNMKLIGFAKDIR